MSNKPFYEECAKHAIRFYVKHPVLCEPRNVKLSGMRPTDIQNWHACDEVLSRYTDSERATLIGVYRSKCAMTDAVKCISDQLRVPENSVWQLMKRFARGYAKQRGLI